MPDDIANSAAPRPRPLTVHALIFGAISGAIAAALYWAQFAFSFHHIAGFFTLLSIALIGTILGVIRWRDRHRGGVINFAQAFGAGLAIGLVFAVVQGAFAWLLINYIEPDALEQLATAQRAALERAGRSAPEIDEALRLFREGITPGNYPRVVFVSWLLVTFVSALVAGLFVRRQVSPA